MPKKSIKIEEGIDKELYLSLIVNGRKVKVGIYKFESEEKLKIAIYNGSNLTVEVRVSDDEIVRNYVKNITIQEACRTDIACPNYFFYGKLDHDHIEKYT